MIFYRKFLISLFIVCGLVLNPLTNFIGDSQANAATLSGLQCVDFFSLDSSARLKQNYIARAFAQIHLSAPKSKDIASILKRWKIDKSTPYSLEQLAQELILENTDLQKSFLKNFKEFFLGTSTKEFFQVRAQTLLLKNALSDLLIRDGKLHKNSALQNVRNLMSKNLNKNKLGRFILINGLIYWAIPQFFGIHVPHIFFDLPIAYIPAFNFAANLNFSRADLLMVQKDGFEKAYSVLKWKYKVPVSLQSFFDKFPRMFYLSIPLTMALNFFATQANEIPHDSPIYIAWEKKFEKDNARPPNLATFGGNQKDKVLWEETEAVIRNLFEREFVQVHAREPELYNPKDISEWQAFLAKFPSADEVGSSKSHQESN